MARIEIRGVTIDSPHSKDLDDAIWVEPSADGWTVQVAIALVSETVLKDEPHDVAARGSGFTLYAGFGDCRPMLPVSLSEEELSLVPGAEKSVMAVTVHLDRSLRVLSSELARGTLKNEGRLSHAQAGRIIEEPSSPLHMMMKSAWTVASGLLHARRQGGALAYFSLSSGVMTDEEGRLVDLGKFKEASCAYIVVQELMILANSALAEFFAKKGIRLVFRNHRGNPVADRSALVSDLATASDGGQQAAAATRRLNIMIERATLSPQATGHFALNLPVYAWFTSPIRRYADLVNQRIALAVIDGHPSPYTGDELDGICSGLNSLYLREGEARADYLKGESERAALAMRRDSDFSGLDDIKMTAVIKSAYEDRFFSGELVSEIERRLASNVLTSKDVGRLLMSGECPEVVKVAVTHLAANPNLSVQALLYLTQDRFATEIEWTEGQDGTIFTATGTFEIGGRSLTASGRGTSKKSARQEASAGLVMAMTGVKVDTVGLAPGNVAERSTLSVPVNAKGDLIALCQTRKLGDPVFHVVHNGPSHAPTFSATIDLSVGGEVFRSGPHDAGTRKDAERLAAVAMLERLVDIRGDAKPSAPVHANPKSALQEYCQKKGWPLPVYSIKQTGPSHKPTFEVSALIAAPGGNFNSPTVAAGSRKDAEQKAAAAMLEIVPSRHSPQA